MESEKISVEIDLARIRSNTQTILKQTGVELIAVVKADAYGLGAKRVVEAIADLCDGLCIFSLLEAKRNDLGEISRKPIISLGPSDHFEAADFKAAGVRPSVWTSAQASRLASADPIICLDTGMQRFACTASEIDSLLRAARFTEAFTHATKMEHVETLKRIFAGRRMKLHASASSLLDIPVAWLDAVRPGIALYRGAATIKTCLVETRRANGPVGYTGFSADYFGVIIGGYSNGIRKGPCRVNGNEQQIVEVGMQSAFVTLEEKDRAGDEVILLGEGLTESTVASAWGTSEQHALFALASSGKRTYRSA